MIIIEIRKKSEVGNAEKDIGFIIGYLYTVELIVYLERCRGKGNGKESRG